MTTTTSGPSGRYRGGSSGPVQYSAAEYADAGMIESFKMRAREFASKLKELATLKTYGDSTLEKRKQELLSYGQSVKEKIAAVTKGYDELSRAIGLGAAPLIAAGVVALALAAIAKFGTDYAAFRQKQQYVERVYLDAQKQGATAAQAAQIAAESANQAFPESASFFGLDLRTLAMLGVGAAALLYFLNRPARSA